MARIVETNPRFRTKVQICSDVACVLNAQLSWGTQFAVLAEAFWVWSEFDGKYSGCRFWSVNAWKQQHELRSLRHDHAIPKKVLVERLIQLRGDATETSVHKVLESWCFGVVITKAEDDRLTSFGLRARMPSDWDLADPWARYRHAGIALRKGSEKQVKHRT
jgi:hypothetical protein